MVLLDRADRADRADLAVLTHIDLASAARRCTHSASELSGGVAIVLVT